MGVGGPEGYQRLPRGPRHILVVLLRKFEKMDFSGGGGLVLDLPDSSPFRLAQDFFSDIY